ncbi:hypothetical protein GB931_21020 [Modestobacter sp. I12A-02628]|uniref:LppX_LprAFG lipoprotein n=1 Tax=Goekera deserti TaxID=2497753 RepID=A0A7K3WFY5_9ACTN|nr:hypothetical protein [Goekera deserti]MPR00356.1 hypothetical protein [Goekera deserti]NDI50441.1 hypothetical protein [Goekera deserti]NEL55292.1 hypothetical protein [Goekera deserti]
MPAARRLLVALGLVLALLAGCSDDGAAERTPGDAITSQEAEVLAGLLYRDFQEGGADFVLTAPYAEGTVLTLTGQVDFARQIGTATAVTTFGDGRPDDSRTLWFDPDEIWFGDVPGLTDALAAQGRPGISVMRRPIVTQAGGSASLVDVLVQLVPRLSARTADDPRAILERDYTWQGQRSIDGQLAVDYRTGSGATVSVAASSQLLLQYVTPLPQQDFSVTITLSDHGSREITLPAEDQTVAAADYPDVAGRLGV